MVYNNVNNVKQVILLINTIPALFVIKSVLIVSIPRRIVLITITITIKSKNVIQH